MENGTQNVTTNRLARIEDKISPETCLTIGVNESKGGMQFANMLQVMDFAKLMAVSSVAVPKHLRGDPGACLAICIQAIEWRMVSTTITGWILWSFVRVWNGQDYPCRLRR